MFYFVVFSIPFFSGSLPSYYLTITRTIQILHLLQKEAITERKLLVWSFFVSNLLYPSEEMYMLEGPDLSVVGVNMMDLILEISDTKGCRNWSQELKVLMCHRNSQSFSSQGEVIPRRVLGSPVLCNLSQKLRLALGGWWTHQITQQFS